MHTGCLLPWLLEVASYRCSWDHELENTLHILQLTVLDSAAPRVVIYTLRASDLVFNSMAPGSGEPLSLGDALQGSRWGFRPFSVMALFCGQLVQT